jgi:uncharacterized DUF497 family protein
MVEFDGRVFDWDTKKNMANINKHGISFKEAASVFSDTSAKYFDDDSHSAHEERCIVIGKSKRLNILMVCHCHRNNNSVIRLISARKADKEEIEIYEEDSCE